MLFLSEIQAHSFSFPCMQVSPREQAYHPLHQGIADGKKCETKHAEAEPKCNRQ